MSIKRKAFILVEIEIGKVRVSKRSHTAFSRIA